jgi:hypothetical protein
VRIEGVAIGGRWLEKPEVEGTIQNASRRLNGAEAIAARRAGSPNYPGDSSKAIKSRRRSAIRKKITSKMKIKSRIRHGRGGDGAFSQLAVLPEA